MKGTGKAPYAKLAPAWSPLTTGLYASR